jgi:hypothetical protein
MKTKALAINPTINTLIENIRLEIEKGKERAYLAMEKEKTLTYWNVGKHIKEHLLENEDRADYGEQVIVQLANNINISKSTLYNSLQFYEEYPNIFHAPGKLTWTHYTTLLTVSEKKDRKEYEEKTIAKNLSTRELQDLIKKDKKPSKNYVSEA